MSDEGMLLKTKKKKKKTSGSTISDWTPVEESPTRRKESKARSPSKPTPFVRNTTSSTPKPPFRMNNTTTTSSTRYPMPNMMMNENNDDELSNVLMAWYYSGYYTGQYKARQEAKHEIAMLREEIRLLRNQTKGQR
eukprot:g7305.t1